MSRIIEPNNCFNVGFVLIFSAMRRISEISTIQTALATVREQLELVPESNIPEIIGKLYESLAVAQQRLFLKVRQTTTTPDNLIGPAEAAKRLGVSKEQVYRQSAKWPFTRRMGRKLLFSSNGIDNFIAS